MKLKQSLTILAGSLLLAMGQASATTLTFEDLAEGAVLANQYAVQGAVFTANAFTGPGNSTSGKPWATNTDMTVTASDLGIPGTPALVSGKVLHALGGVYQPGWFLENGDPSFRVTFSSAATFVSATFVGVDTPADVHLYVYNGLTQIADVTSAVTTGQYVLSFSAAAITSVIITPGSFDDWVGVDNITYTLTPVPEVSTYAMMGAGLALLAFRRRKSA